MGDRWSKVAPAVVTALTGLYFLWYLLCTARVRVQLSKQAFAAFRAANILYQLQVSMQEGSTAGDGYWHCVIIAPVKHAGQ